MRLADSYWQNWRDGWTMLTYGARTADCPLLVNIIVTAIMVLIVVPCCALGLCPSDGE